MKKFVPENYLQVYYMQLYDLREYTEEFDLLTTRCAMAEPDEQTIARYIGGLWKEICNVVVLRRHYSYNDVYKLAVTVEKQ